MPPHVAPTPLATATLGDYRYILERRDDGTLRCTQEPLDGWQVDEVDDWAQLPPEVRTIFAQAAQNRADA